MSRFPDYDRFDGVGLAELLKKREVSTSELVEEAIARIARVNPKINAVVYAMYGYARQCASEEHSGFFGGIPFLLKDLLQTVPGIPTNAGSYFYRGRTALEEGTLHRRFRDAGLITVAKTNTPELGILPVTEPELFGPSRNPWDLERTPGGSSGGSAAAVAAGVVPIASGGDGGGSIRIPASCCGLFGLKPTRGRTPAGPYASEHWNGLAVEHVITRSVRDSAAVLDAVAGIEPGAPYDAPPLGGSMLEACRRDPEPLRIAFHAEPAFPSTVDPECVRAVTRAAELCEELGHHVEERPPGHEPRLLARHLYTIIATSVATDLAEGEIELGKTLSRSDVELTTYLSYLIGKTIRATDLQLAIRGLQAETRRLARVFEGFDLVLTPTLASPPIEVGALQPSFAERMLLRALARAESERLLSMTKPIDQAVDRVFDFVPFTPVANFTGQPSVSVPLHFTADGLPVGVMFTAELGAEQKLFALAGQLERAHPWGDRRPPLWAGASS